MLPDLKKALTERDYAYFIPYLVLVYLSLLFYFLTCLTSPGYVKRKMDPDQSMEDLERDQSHLEEVWNARIRLTLSFVDQLSCSDAITVNIAKPAFRTSGSYQAEILRHLQDKCKLLTRQRFFQ